MARTGTGFVNLNKYIQANRGTTLSPFIGQQVGKDVASTQGMAKQSSERFGQDVEANRLGTQGDIAERSRILGAVSNLSDPQQVVGGPDQTPDQIGEGDINAFKRFTSGEYKGPGELKDAATIQSKLGELRDVGKQLSPTTTSDKFALLNRYVSSPTYNMGKRSLDTLFLDPNSLGGARKGIQQAGREVESSLTGARGKADVARSEAAQFGKGTKQELGLTETGSVDPQSDKGLAQIKKNIAARYEQDKNLKEEEFNKTQQIPGDIQNTYNADSVHRSAGKDLRSYLNSMGLNDYDVQSSYGLVGSPELSQIFSRSGISANAQNIASLPEYAQYEALARLGGVENNYLSDPTQARKYYDTPGYNVNKELLDTLVSSRKGEYEQKRSMMDEDLKQQQAYLEALRVQRDRTDQGGGFLQGPDKPKVKPEVLDNLMKEASQRHDVSAKALRELIRMYGQDEPNYIQNPLSPKGPRFNGGVV